MKAIILAAGLGTRLRPLTNEIPKVMLPLNSKPLIFYQIQWFKKYGINDIAINLHHLPEKIKDYLGDGSKLNVKITYSYENDILGTAGAVKKLENFLNNESFVVFYGDNITNLNLSELSHFHKGKKAIATICLHKKQDGEKDFGIVNLDKNNKILQFIEKPDISKIYDSALINSGIYALEPEVLDFIPKNKFFDFAYDLFPLILKKNKVIFGFTSDCYWAEVGNLQKYEKIKKEIDDLNFDF